MKQIFILFTLTLLISSCGSDFNGLSPKEYVDQNNLEATELENGVYIVIHDVGNEVKPGLDDVIVTDYRGFLADNNSTFNDEEDSQEVLGNLIAGWYIGLREIGEGGSATLIIPPAMAFGDRRIGNIPGKSTVVFDIDLKQVFKPTTVQGYIDRNQLVTQELDKGVHIIIDVPGNEIKPRIDHDIVVTYTGKFTNELVFDEGQGIEFNLGDLIEGWQIGLPEIGEGGKCTLILPSEVAYGKNGNSVIPPDEPLVFELELITVKRTKADIYVEENNLSTIVLDKGVHIVIHDNGSDTKPVLTDNITIDYTGTLTDGEEFDSGMDAEFALSGLIEGMRIGLMEIGVGGSATVIVPPAVGYGNASQPNIPANSALIFDVTLKSID